MTERAGRRHTSLTGGSLCARTRPRSPPETPGFDTFEFFRGHTAAQATEFKEKFSLRDNHPVAAAANKKRIQALLMQLIYRQLVGQVESQLDEVPAVFSKAK